jgi:type VI secretion system secreted protein VgrG
MRSLIRPAVSLAVVLSAVLAAPSAHAQFKGSLSNGRQQLLGSSAQQSFPNLGSRFVVLGGATRRYNCIAHSVGDHSQWVWPGDRISDFNRLYGQHGFSRIRGLDFRHRSDQNKIVLYGKRGTGRIEATHAARMYHGSRRGWTSKLGAWPLIWHPSVYSVTGPSYGQPVAVYVRPRR